MLREGEGEKGSLVSDFCLVATVLRVNWGGAWSWRGQCSIMYPQFLNRVHLASLKVKWGEKGCWDAGAGSRNGHDVLEHKTETAMGKLTIIIKIFKDNLVYIFVGNMEKIIDSLEAPFELGRHGTGTVALRIIRFHHDLWLDLPDKWSDIVKDISKTFLQLRELSIESMEIPLSGFQSDGHEHRVAQNRKIIQYPTKR